MEGRSPMRATQGRAMVPCPVCGGYGFKRLFSKKTDDYVRCGKCGLVMINPQPTDEEVAALYNKDYYRSWGLEGDYSAVAEMKSATFDTKIRIVEQYSDRGRLLDIGCASGFLLEAAKKRGWNPYGVELSEESASIAQVKFGKDRVFNGTIDKASFEDGFFEAVFMVDLIEHVKDVNGFLEQVSRIVKEGGIAAIVTPDAGSLSYRLMGNAWPHIKLEHLYYFSKSTISAILKKHGFRVVMSAPSLKALTAGYVQRHFMKYKIPFVSCIVKAVAWLIPKGLSGVNFTVRTGEIFIVAKKMRKKD